MNKYQMIFLQSLILIAIVLLLFLIIMISNVKLHYPSEKMSMFECGLDIFNKFSKNLSFRFFFVAMLFLIFDLEIILIIPFSWQALSTSYLASSLLFITITMAFFTLLSKEMMFSSFIWFKE
uniref:NADH-ubiquinone oxidoreductase chain 3 n=1 Tax=Gnathostomula paradoxa TaxID=66783 RepID=A0A0F6Q187_9BILA|nr:NADH dehydrogenase subunit 3 [Gnathostomula paradoxa]AKD00039.1 NADH dehydrogenase subunit 3 [Gnathostomula paradoxa]